MRFRRNGGDPMNKKIKMAIIISVSLILVVILLHLTVNYIVPTIFEMHSGGNKY